MQKGQVLSDYAEAKRMLALAYLQNDQPKKAIPLLKDTAQTLSQDAATPRARSIQSSWVEVTLDLAETHLAAKQPAEASLTAQDAIRVIEKNAPTVQSTRLRARALLIRAEALVDFKKYLEARTLIDEWQELQRGSPSSFDLQALASLLRTRIRWSECRLLASEKNMEEARFLAEVQERGLCLRETLTPLLATAGSKLEDAAVREFNGEWSAYRSLVNTPPTPNHLLTDSQKPNYIRDLSGKSYELWKEQRRLSLEPFTPSSSNSNDPTFSTARETMISRLKVILSRS